jgi:iron complex outermembrane recepter protein
VPGRLRDNEGDLMNRKLALSFFSASTVFCCGTILAGEADTGPAEESSSSGGGAVLQEITVSARRQRENLQEVPISVSAITMDEIRAKNISSPDDFNASVPGLTVTPTSLDRASVTYTIRGQGQILGGPDAAVATYFNDVPTVITSSGYMFDLENMEVLKGPQGTLFGVNSTGGAVLFVPQRPTGELGGYVEVTNGNYNARRYQGALNVPLPNDTLRIRLAFDANYRDGYTINPVDGHQYDDTDYQAARLGVLYKPFERLENYFLVNIATLNEHGAGNECIAYNPNGNFVNFAGDLAGACAAQQAYGPRYVNAWIPPNGDFIRTRNYAADDTLTYQVSDNFTLKNIFAYRQYQYGQSYENYGTPFPVFEYSLVNQWSAGLGVAQPSQKKYSDEIQAHGNAFNHKLHWQSGLFFDTQSPNSLNDIDVATFYSIALVTFQSLNWKKRHAIYGQAGYDFTDKLNLTLGARYTEDLRRQLTPPQDLSAKFHATTWNASLQYKATDDVMVYATTRRGYKSGGFNNVAFTGAQQYQPEFVTDFELGAKTEFHLGSVKGRINFDIYRSQFDKWQERVTKLYDTPNGPLPFAVVTNVAKGVVQGADLDFTIIPVPQLEISGFWGYVDPYFTSNTVDGVDFSRRPVAEIVRNKVSGTVKYLFGLPSTVGDASVSVTYSYQSARSGALDLDPELTPDPLGHQTPGYGLLNARLEWNNVMGHPLDLSAFVDNLNNKLYFTLLNDFWSGGQDTGQYGPPRMFGVSARLRF